MRLTLIRHGETDWNRDGRYQGQYNVPLNPAGVLQAHALAERLKDATFDAVYSSDLDRARMTAQIAVHQPVHADTRLREPDYGVFQGLTYVEMEARYPDIFAAWQPARLIAPPNGESMESVAARIESFLADLRATHEGHSVLVVSHGELLQLMLCRCLALPLKQRTTFRLDNASISIVEFSMAGAALTQLNDKALVKA